MNEKLVVESYRAIRPSYVLLTEKIQSLLTELLNLREIRFHLIDGRAKTVDSFQEKIRRPSKSYSDPLTELTDLSGVRVIAYYHDDIEKIADVLSSEFQVVEEVSHQASEYDPEEFGYISLHYIVKISQDRAELAEWNAYKDLLAEVQIRTVLQHSWASISHALQYKNEADVPKSLRRKLNRLAGLFELADEQFVDIRLESDTVKKKVSEQIKAGNHQIPIDPISLREFLNGWSKLGEIVSFMRSVGFSFDEPPYEPYWDERSDELDYLGVTSEHCHRVGLETIEELESALSYDPRKYLQSLFEFDKGDWYVSESFTLYLLLIRAKIEHFSVGDLLSSGWGESTAEKVISLAQDDEN
ncbi:hypothetical protein BA953_16550 [Vibrio coralliilyticus]|uniref:GTP pyrophosphokinase n=1 Tax=Vibrio coralliilyticus TaxID=190893 RepID=UPI000810D44B|nr:hypothetical protein [Vibrio coralliilyticus]ANW25806.1 hypothetical protein BA953_16550 [Vibrio coralliilyticus]